MSLSIKIKKDLLLQVQQIVDQKINTAQSIIDSVIESKNNETKSTAGDKYETGRAMMQVEQEKTELRLNEAHKLKAILNRISTTDTHEEIQLGSVVITNTAAYFISVGVGKIQAQNQIFYAISPESPIGKLLMYKKANDHFIFQENKRTVLVLI